MTKYFRFDSQVMRIIIDYQYRHHWQSSCCVGRKQGRERKSIDKYLNLLDDYSPSDSIFKSITMKNGKQCQTVSTGATVREKVQWSIYLETSSFSRAHFYLFLYVQCRIHESMIHHLEKRLKIDLVTLHDDVANANDVNQFLSVFRSLKFSQKFAQQSQEMPSQHATNDLLSRHIWRSHSTVPSPRAPPTCTHRQFQWSTNYISNNKTQHTRQFSPLAIDLMQPPLSQRIADEMELASNRVTKTTRKKKITSASSSKQWVILLV